MLAVLVFDVLVKTLRTHLMAHLLEWINKLTGSAYLDRLFGATLSDLNDTNAPPLSEQFSELIRVNQAVSVAMMVFLMDALFSTVVVAILLLLHPVLALVSMAPILPICILTFLQSPAQRKRSMAFHKEQRDCQYRLAEVLRSSETLHSLNAGEFKKSQMSDNISGFLQRSFKVSLDQIGSGNMQGFLINMGSILTLYVGAHVVLAGEISFGVYIAINMLSRTVLGSLQKLIGAMAQMSDTMNASDQLKEVFEEAAPKAASGAPAIRLEKSQGLLAFHNVSFRYGDDQPWVLKDLSFTVRPGERVVITGKSGAGKTTLIRLMQRLYEPGKGYITLDGYNIADMDEGNLRQHVAVALQKPAIFSGTVFDNIALARPGVSKKEVVEAVKMAEFEEAVFEFPEGLETKTNHFGLNLSGGQISRIAIARLFLANPAMVVIDEALSNVPPAMGVTILNNIHKTFRQASCVFVSNFIPLHQSVDRIIVIDDGHVVEEGTFKALVEKKSHYHKLFDPNARLASSGQGQ